MIWFDHEETLTKITGLKHDELWDVGINLDDWDYGVIIEGKYKGIIKNTYCLERLLQGCCDNVWEQIETPKGIFTIGMAYHS